jgi:hypothetical protein
MPGSVPGSAPGATPVPGSATAGDHAAVASRAFFPRAPVLPARPAVPAREATRPAGAVPCPVIIVLVLPPARPVILGGLLAGARPRRRRRAVAVRVPPAEVTVCTLGCRAATAQVLGIPWTSVSHALPLWAAAPAEPKSLHHAALQRRPPLTPPCSPPATRPHTTASAGQAAQHGRECAAQPVPHLCHGQRGCSSSLGAVAPGGGVSRGREPG